MKDSGQEIRTNQQPEDTSRNAGKAYTEHGTEPEELDSIPRSIENSFLPHCTQTGYGAAAGPYPMETGRFLRAPYVGVKQSEVGGGRS
jgi:hypothetical protein